MSTRFPQRGPAGFGRIGSGAPPPRDLLVVLGVLFVTFSMQFFSSTAVVPALLGLTPLVLRGYVWQLFTYPFIATASSGFWFLLELLILFWFGRDVYWRLGRRRFWEVVLWSAVGAAVVAVAVEAVMLAADASHAPFVSMQGQRMLLTIVIAAFATLYGEATILLFFVLPIKARWFLWLEVLFAFVFGLLPPQIRDVPGFLGVCAAVFLTYSSLLPGGPKRVLHSWRKRTEAWTIEQRLKRMRRRRRFEVIEGDRDEYIH